MSNGPARLLAIMGSGETSPTMSSVHTDLFARLGLAPVPAVVLDTPFGFQENASEITAKAVHYFRENVGRPIEVASLRTAGIDELAYETMLARLRQARYVFAGPGSPSYALRLWRESPVRDALAEKLRAGGCVTFSSAAACTLGRVALPVYEVYKVGADPFWLDGLDLLGECGINAAVIPHDNNTEGGTHDTRHCYMGERRLRVLEEQLPTGTFILGVDEHTVCIIDLDADTLSVRGIGGVTLRHGGRQRRLEKGAVEPLALLRDGVPAADRSDGTRVFDAEGADADGGAETDGVANPFMEVVAAQQGVFDEALAAGRVDDAVAALLALDSHLWEWSRETFATDDMDRARSLQRTMLVRFTDLAHTGARDPREVVGPFVETVLDLRRDARAQSRFADADALRDQLIELGVEIHDSPAGTRWTLREESPARSG